MTRLESSLDVRSLHTCLTGDWHSHLFCLCFRQSKGLLCLLYTSEKRYVSSMLCCLCSLSGLSSRQPITCTLSNLTKPFQPLFQHYHGIETSAWRRRSGQRSRRSDLASQLYRQRLRRFALICVSLAAHLCSILSHSVPLSASLHDGTGGTGGSCANRAIPSIHSLYQSNLANSDLI